MNPYKIFLLLFAALGLASPTMSFAQTTPAQNTIQGTWVGNFGAGNWTFEFAKQEAGWSGRYTYPAYNGWNRLRDLSASEKQAKFSIRSDISMTFDLGLSKFGVLAGNLELGPNAKTGRKAMMIPFQLKRAPPR